MRVEVNGTEIELEAGATVLETALKLDVDPAARGMAVAVDGEVVPRSELAATVLREGQRLEVVAAIQGGAR